MCPLNHFISWCMQAVPRCCPMSVHACAWLAWSMRSTLLCMSWHGWPATWYITQHAMLIGTLKHLSECLNDIRIWTPNSSTACTRLPCCTHSDHGQNFLAHSCLSSWAQKILLSTKRAFLTLIKITHMRAPSSFTLSPPCACVQLYVPRIPGVPPDYFIPPEKYGLNSEVGDWQQCMPGRWFHYPGHGAGMERISLFRPFYPCVPNLYQMHRCAWWSFGRAWNDRMQTFHLALNCSSDINTVIQGWFWVINQYQWVTPWCAVSTWPCSYCKAVRRTSWETHCA